MDRYAQQAAELAEELVASLSESEIQHLREAFEAATPNEVFDWCEAAADEVRAFVRATPSARRKKIRWREAYPLLTYFSYVHCCKANALLTAVDRFDLTPGGPYRDMALQAGDAYQLAGNLELDWPSWPWDGDSPLPWVRDHS